MLCPCCSNKPFESCCAPYLSGMIKAPTPEALMRSRYTAYSQANIDYIAHTMTGPAAEGFNPEDGRKWAKSIRWVKLEVLSSSLNGDQGEVSFKAYYVKKNKPYILAERSLFRKIHGEWKYLSSLN
jgi:SEC-C motif-containing protein